MTTTANDRKEAATALLAADARAFVEAIAANMPPLTGADPADIRALAADLAPSIEGTPSIKRSTAVTIVPEGVTPPFDGLLIEPEGHAAGLIVFFHGGGWVIGSPDGHHAFARHLAAATGCAVLLPRYRLAPESPFPAAVEDAEQAVRWAARHVADLLGHTAPIVIGGDSAGGNLAAVAALQLRGAIPIAAQILVYPVTDHDLATPSYREFVDGPVLSRADMEWFWDHYVPEQADRTSPLASPLRHPDLAGLPRAIFVIAEVDPLRSEAEAYAAALKAAGNDVVARRFMGMPHGFFPLPAMIGGAAEALSFVAAELRRTLHRAG